MTFPHEKNDFSQKTPFFQRKKAAEKNVSELRKQISKQKRLMSTKRCSALPAIGTARKCIK